MFCIAVFNVDFIGGVVLMNNEFLELTKTVLEHNEESERKATLELFGEINYFTLYVMTGRGAEAVIDYGDRHFSCVAATPENINAAIKWIKSLDRTEVTA